MITLITKTIHHLPITQLQLTIPSRTLTGTSSSLHHHHHQIRHTSTPSSSQTSIHSLASTLSTTPVLSDGTTQKDVKCSVNSLLMQVRYSYINIGLNSHTYYYAKYNSLTHIIIMARLNKTICIVCIIVCNGRLIFSSCYILILTRFQQQQKSFAS